MLPATWLCSFVAMRVFWEDAAEETGDLRAMRGSGLSDRQYGAVLKSLAVASADGDYIPALGFYPGIGNLAPGTRTVALRLIARLRGLRLAGKWSESLPGSVGACCRAILIGGLLLLLAAHSQIRGLLQDPRRLVAQTPLVVRSVASAQLSDERKASLKKPKADRQSTHLNRFEDKTHRRDEKRPKREKRPEPVVF